MRIAGVSRRCFALAARAGVSMATLPLVSGALKVGS